MLTPVCLCQGQEARTWGGDFQSGLGSPRGPAGRHPPSRPRTGPAPGDSEHQGPPGQRSSTSSVQECHRGAEPASRACDRCRAQGRPCSAIAILRFFMPFEQRPLRFHFAPGSVHDVAGPTWGGLSKPTLLGSFPRILIQGVWVGPGNLFSWHAPRCEFREFSESEDRSSTLG